MEIQVRERRGQRKVKGGESGNVLGPRELSWKWGWGGEEEERRAGAEAAVEAFWEKQRDTGISSAVPT